MSRPLTDAMWPLSTPFSTNQVSQAELLYFAEIMCSINVRFLSKIEKIGPLDLGPFNIGDSCTLALFIALIVAEKGWALLQLPNWLQIEGLRKSIEIENENKDLCFPPDEFYYEIMTIFFNK